MENEYRICSISDNEYDYIDIKSSFVGMIVSNRGLNEYLYSVYASFLNNCFCPKNNLILSFDNKNLNIKQFKL